MSDVYTSTAKVAARYGVHRTTLWRWLHVDPTFPKPVTLSPGCVRWRLSDLEAWEAAKLSLAMGTK